MASEAAKLLDELMGRNRNAAPYEGCRDMRWEDPEVCKFHLCDFCPHDLFVNTRADLGTCDKVHDDELKKGYLKSSRCGRMGYEEEYLRFLQDLLADVERRIKKGQSRLHLNNAQVSAGPHAQREEKIEMLTQRINDLVQQAEELGCEGNVEQAQGVLKLCEKLREERTQLESSTLNMLSQPKEMEVCNVCGAFLVINDAQQRVDEHLMGKQHMGYAKLRVTVDDLKKKLRGETDAEREARLNKEREDRTKEREERQKKEKELEMEREKEREERRKRRKEEEEARKKKRSRSRSKSRRSRSKERTGKSRSKDRRSRSRDRHSRRSSRDRHRSKHSHRSRSRDKKSSRDDRRSHDRDHRSRDKKSSRDRERSSKEREKSSRDRTSKDRSSKDRSSKDRTNYTENRPSDDATKGEQYEQQQQQDNGPVSEAETRMETEDVQQVDGSKHQTNEEGAGVACDTNKVAYGVESGEDCPPQEQAQSPMEDGEQ